MRRFTAIFSITLIVSSIVFTSIGRGYAASFNPNNIISDNAFDKISTMSDAQIDNFLNGFSGSCISTNNGFTAADPIGYNLNQGYLYGSPVSAGKVIFDAAQAYGINPQVLITTLQKEEGLVRGDGPYGCSALSISAAMGYACTDSDTASHTYTYTNGTDPGTLSTPLYYHNGTPVNTVTNTCVNTVLKAGFTEQVIRAAWLLKFGEQRSEGNINWAVIKSGWDNSEDPQSCYGGPMTQGTWQRCPSGGIVDYDGYTTIDGSAVHMDNGATAALYWYTPHFSGNQSFFNLFTTWFKNSLLTVPTSCDSKVSGIVCVWSLLKTDGSQFLTSSISEMNSAISNYGWTYDGLAFYASQDQQDSTLPVHRLRQNGLHFYTADQSEYNTMIASGNWVDEGIVFYTYPTSASNSISYNVYRLYKASSGIRYYTTDTLQEQYFLSIGFTLESNSFRSFSGLVQVPVPAAGRDNIYRTRGLAGYFYTTSLPELDLVISNGQAYEGLLTTADSSGSGTPIYRLQRNGKYFYTADANERDIAVSKYGYTYEEIGFYTDSSSADIYRLGNTITNSYFYTSNINEAMSVVNTGGWIYNGTLVSNSSSPSPVYRFLNNRGNRHFYTIDINEATSIANKGWRYETVAFYASKTAGQPIYRLLSYDMHFYTADPNEKDIAISKYGYSYEGIGFYANTTSTSTPIYRLHGGNGEYFYTASSTEKDSAVSKYGYSYEGVAFYQ